MALETLEKLEKSENKASLAQRESLVPIRSTALVLREASSTLVVALESHILSRKNVEINEFIAIVIEICLHEGIKLLQN